MQGGAKTNMVPAYYAPSIDRRVTPEERLEDVEKKFRVFVDMIASEYPEVRVEVMTTNKLNPTLMNPEPRIVNPVRSATEEVLGYSPRTTISLGGLGMRYYTEVGVPLNAPKGDANPRPMRGNRDEAMTSTYINLHQS
ncbi:MAG: hypothetical protein QW705_01270 [Zestosphaera sp.]